MKSISIEKAKAFLFLGISSILFSACSLVGLDMQDSYDYKKQTLDPHIGMSARAFLESRANGNDQNANDTVFKWMKKGLDYAEFDLAEYEKPGRTFIFLHNDAVRRFTVTVTGGVTVITTTGGLFFDYPIVLENPDGTIQIDPVTKLVKTKPATQWTDYKKETVKKYFLYLIGQGEFNFEQLGAENTAIQSLLPPNSEPDQGEKSTMRFGFVNNNNKFFDQEGKFSLKIQNNSDLGPIMINNATTARSAGYVAANGIVHVFGNSIFPYKLQ